MSSLPIELFQQIFYQLHQQDKAQCMLVCHRWKVMLEQYALFHTIVINSEHSFRRILEKMEREPHLASRVEQLFVGSLDNKADVNTLLLLLTNIKSLYFLPNAGKTPTLESGVTYPWKDGIKKIVDYSSNRPSHSLLTSSTCSNLTMLITDIRDKSPEIFESTPFLTALVLITFDTDFDGLEILHDTLPRLESLKIKYGQFYGPELDETSIKPAVSVIECLYGFNVIGSAVPGRINLLKYMRKKYPNMSALAYTDNGESSNNILQKYDDFGWIPLINNLGARLTKISIDSQALSNDFLKILDQSGCQINYLRVSIDSLTSLFTIADSQQVHHIQTLTIKLKKSVYLGGFHWLKYFEKLRKFKLISNVTRSLYFKLEDLLDKSPPMLRILSIHSFHLNYRPDCVNTYPIESLSLKMARLPYNTDSVISRYFPKLSKLKLKYCLMDTKIFNLGSLNLVDFSFATYLLKKDIVILADCKGRKRWYSYRMASLLPTFHNQYDNAQQRSLIVPFKLSTENKTNEQADFTIKFHFMTTLPTEILKEMFLHLYQHDKLNCMLVCRHWKNVIECSSLYHTLYVNSPPYLETLTEKLQKLPKAARQTERVVIHFRYQSDHHTLLNTLLMLLPNLKVLLLLYMNGPLDTSVIHSEGEAYPWAQQITRLSETAGHHVTQRLFESQLSLSGSCANLTTLEINLNGLLGDFISPYFDNFKYVPGLKRLKIDDFNANLDQLDILHKHLPHLKSVSFDNVILIGHYILDEVNSDRITIRDKTTIVPATSVTDCLFHFRTADTVQKHIELLDYITKKYPNLTSLSYISHRNTIANDGAQQINQRGWIPLLSQLGPKLKKLWVNHSANLDNVFATLDQCHCDVSYLKLGFYPWRIVNEIQTRHIQTLALSISEKVKLDDFDWLKQLGSLKKLKLRSYNNRKLELKLKTLIDNAPPTLKILSLFGVRISISMRYSGSTTIETLSLKSVKVPDNLGVFLSRHFPTLTKLKLCHCLLGQGFSMPTNDYVCLYEPSVWDDKDVLLITQSERRFYRIKSDGIKRIWFDFKTIPKPVDDDDDNTVPLKL